ncbi:unnamed protein product, partial [Ectocarpus sp. 12 AP-2014]
MRTQVDKVRLGQAYPLIDVNDVLIFLKLFDPNGLPLPHLTYVGHTLLAGDASSEVIAEEAIRLAGLPPSTPIDLYEQVTPRVVNKVPQDKTLSENELQHGDIILFQIRPDKVVKPEGDDKMDVEGQDQPQEQQQPGVGGGGEAGAVAAAAAAAPAAAPDGAG